MRTIFEQSGGSYTQVGDYQRYIQQHQKVRYSHLLTTGRLNAYLHEVDERAETLFFRIVNEMAFSEGITEDLKAQNQLLWVQRMNNIRSRAEEIVNSEVIFA